MYFCISTYVCMYFMYSIMCYELELCNKSPYLCVSLVKILNNSWSVSSPVKLDNIVPT